jgi:hypothetical protein
LKSYESLVSLAKVRPEVCSGLLLSSFPWHWQGAGLATPPASYFIAFLGATYPLTPDTVGRINWAMRGYGMVPVEV